MGYKHLTREQRYTIEALLQTPMSQREMGEVIGGSTGTVSREIRRNSDMCGYHCYQWEPAQKKYERRIKSRRHDLKFTDEMKRTVRRFIIYEHHSPEQICGRFKLKGKEMVAQRPSTVGSGRRSAVVMTRWLVTSGIWGDGNEDVTSFMDPEGSFRTGFT